VPDVVISPSVPELLYRTLPEVPEVIAVVPIIRLAVGALLTQLVPFEVKTFPEVPGVTTDARVKLDHDVPFEVSIFPEVPGAMNVTLLVPLPTIRLLAVRVVSPVPP
jgi:hypothetical protein